MNGVLRGVRGCGGAVVESPVLGRCRAPDFWDGGQHFPVGVFPPDDQISGDDDGGSMGFDVGTRLPGRYCLLAAFTA